MKKSSCIVSKTLNNLSLITAGPHRSTMPLQMTINEEIDLFKLYHTAFFPSPFKA